MVWAHTSRTVLEHHVVSSFDVWVRQAWRFSLRERSDNTTNPRLPGNAGTPVTIWGWFILWFYTDDLGIVYDDESHSTSWFVIQDWPCFLHVPAIFLKLQYWGRKDVEHESRRPICWSKWKGFSAPRCKFSSDFFRLSSIEPGWF